jgi:hypothetical protein
VVKKIMRNFYSFSAFSAIIAFIAITALSASCSAFVPPPVKSFLLDQPGVSAPLGFFDPLGFSENKSILESKKLQEAELKHGRVAMLAAVGLLVQNQFHPFFRGDVDIGSSIYHFQEVASLYPWFTPLIVSMIGLVEFATLRKGWQDIPEKGITPLKEDYIVGDLGLDPYDTKSNPNTFKIIRTKELNNGRLAMIATLLIVLQEWVNTH